MNVLSLLEIPNHILSYFLIFVDSLYYLLHLVYKDNHKKLKDIFSDNITKRCSKFNRDHNKNLIKRLLNEENEERREIFTKLFNLTFLECLEHFRETDYHDELNGMPVLKDEIKKFEEDDYIQSLLYYFKNYEIIIKNKRSRNRNKKKKEDN